MVDVMPQEDIDHFINRAEEILNLTKEALLINGITPPARSFVTIAPEEEVPHDDDDQLTVALGLISPHYPQGQIPTSRGHMNTRMGTFYIELVRCSPAMKSIKGGARKVSPSLQEMTTYGKQRLQEMAVLNQVCIDLCDSPYDSLGRATYAIAAGLDQGQAQAIKVTLQTMV